MLCHDNVDILIQFIVYTLILLLVLKPSNHNYKGTCKKVVYVFLFNKKKRRTKGCPPLIISNRKKKIDPGACASLKLTAMRFFLISPWLFLLVICFAFFFYLLLFFFQFHPLMLGFDWILSFNIWFIIN